MVKNFSLAALATLLLSTFANAGPDALSAMEHFEDYQRQLMRGMPVQRQLSAIREALGITPLFHKTGNYGRPILIFVAYSRAHHRSYEKPFVTVRDEVVRLLPTGNFERRQYQLNDLHPAQGRQQIWQLRDKDTIMRIEVIPGNSITVTFFSSADGTKVLHAIRQALQ